MIRTNYSSHSWIEMGKIPVQLTQEQYDHLWNSHPIERN